MLNNIEPFLCEMLKKTVNFNASGFLIVFSPTTAASLNLVLLFTIYIYI